MSKKANFFIVGAPKSGTSAWAEEYLSSHPGICMAEVKEPHYFAADIPGKRWTDSEEKYEKLFARAGDAGVLGEASVFYLYSTTAAERIKTYNPAAKIVIFLRPQEDLLQSLHHQFLFTFSESIKDFAKAWRLSGKRSPETIPERCADPRLLDYKAMGRFAEQVQRYVDAFPPEQILIIRFADWTSDARATYVRLLRFLGLEDDGRTGFPPVNEAKTHLSKSLTRLILYPPPIVRSAIQAVRRLAGRQAFGLADRAVRLLARPGYRTKASPELRAEIRLYYEDDNRRLNALLADAGVETSGTLP